MPYEITHKYIRSKTERGRKMGEDDFPKPGAVGVSKKSQVAKHNISKELPES